MRYFIWTVLLSSQLVWANEKEVSDKASNPKVAVTVTDSKVSAKCKITHQGQEREGVDEECTNILKDVFSLMQKPPASEKP